MTYFNRVIIVERDSRAMTARVIEALHGYDRIAIQAEQAEVSALSAAEQAEKSAKAASAAEAAAEVAKQVFIPDSYVEREKLSAPLSLDTPIVMTGAASLRQVSRLARGQVADLDLRSYRYDADSALLDNGMTVLKPEGIDATDPGRWVMMPGSFYSTFELTLGNAGSGADFTDLNEALTFCSRFKPEYAYGRSSNGRCINLRILSGTILDQGIALARGQDLGYVRLIADDPVVKVNFPTDVWWAYAEYNSQLPLFSAIFDMQGIGYDGVALKHSSSVCFEYLGPTPISGIINAARNNVFINTDSHGSFRMAKFTGAGESGIHFEKGCHGCARDADVSNAGLNGVTLLNNCFLDVYGLIADGAAQYGILADGGSQASGYGISAKNTGSACFRSANGGKIIAQSASVGAVAAGQSWAYATDGGHINIQDAVGSGGAACAYARRGSEIIASNVNAGSTSGWAFRVDGGSIVKASGSSGTTSQTINTITGAGVIFR